MSTAGATVCVEKEKAPVHTVGPVVTSLPMQDHILANLRVNAGDTQHPSVTTSTSV